MNFNVQKWLTALVSSLTGWATHIPDIINQQTTALVALVVTDTLTGVWSAGRRKRMTEKGGIHSGTMLQMMYRKLKLHAGIALFAVAVCLVTGNIMPLSVALLGLITVEVQSILENIAYLKADAKVNIGPLEPLFTYVTKYFKLPGLDVTPPDPTADALSDLREEVRLWREQSSSAVVAVTPAEAQEAEPESEIAP